MLEAGSADALAPDRDPGPGARTAHRDPNLRHTAIADGVTIMIRLGTRIRLTQREVERFTKITAIEPVGIRTLADLDAYVSRCKAHYWGVSRQTRFLHWLIDREHEQCVGRG